VGQPVLARRDREPLVTAQQWPDEAVRAVAAALAVAQCARVNDGLCQYPEEHRSDDPGTWLPAVSFLPPARDVLAALAPHAVPRPAEWEWGVRWPKSVQHVDDEATARESVAERPNTRSVVRRSAGIAPGPWEVAPAAVAGGES
jgi:hypothetical protein